MVDADRPEFEFQLAGFDARELQQIFSKARQACRMVADNFDEPAPVGRVIKRAAEKGFCETLDGRQWGAKLVRNVRHEVLAHALEAAQFADFM